MTPSGIEPAFFRLVAQCPIIKVVSDFYGIMFTPKTLFLPLYCVPQEILPHPTSHILCYQFRHILQSGCPVPLYHRICFSVLSSVSQSTQTIYPVLSVVIYVCVSQSLLRGSQNSFQGIHGYISVVLTLKFPYFSIQGVVFCCNNRGTQMAICSVLVTVRMPVPVAARSKAQVYGCSPAEIEGSNPTGGMDVCLL